MRCPYCREINQDKVIDSRVSENGEVIRRRRACISCGKRFTTKERVEQDARLMVVKRDGTRVPYDRGKVLAGIQRATYKRPVSDEDITRVVDEVEDNLFKQYDREVSSEAIGQLVCDALRDFDQIAYVRFASVYRQFKDLGQLMDEVNDVIKRKVVDTPGQRQLFE